MPCTAHESGIFSDRTIFTHWYHFSTKGFRRGAKRNFGKNEFSKFSSHQSSITASALCMALLGIEKGSLGLRKTSMPCTAHESGIFSDRKISTHGYHFSTVRGHKNRVTFLFN